MLRHHSRLLHPVWMLRRYSLLRCLQMLYLLLRRLFRLLCFRLVRARLHRSRTGCLPLHMLQE